MSLDNQTFVYIDGKTYNCSQDEAIDPDVAGIGVRKLQEITPEKRKLTS